MATISVTISTGVRYCSWEKYKYTTDKSPETSGGFASGTKSWTATRGKMLIYPSLSDGYVHPIYYQRTGSSSYSQRVTNADGSIHENDITFSQDKTGYLYANKAAPTTYTLSYNLDGGTGDSSTQTKNHGENITLHAAPTKTGYTFQYWQDQTNYSNWGAEVAFTEDRSTTFKAIWTRKTYTVSYNANGGTGAPSAQTKKHGIDLTLTTDEPTWSGHIFLYWQDQGTDYHIWYPGDSFDRNRDTTLTAIWKTACALFYWHGSASADSSKFASGEPVKDALTAAAWNRAIDKTNEIRELLEQSATTIPKVTAGSQITAVAFNQLRLAIGSTIGAGTLPAAVDKGDTISISLFIGTGSLREALNTAIDAYNNSK